MRWITVLAAVVALALNAASVGADTLKQIKKRGEIRIGYREATKPFSFTNAKDEVAGYSVELCKRVAVAVKAKLELQDLRTRFVEVPIAERFEAVANGDVDILCAATTITLERMQKVDFSLMTFVTGGSLMSRADTPIRRTSDLAGRKVAIVRGTTSYASLPTVLEERFIDAELVELDSINEARIALDARDVDAFATDQIVVIGQMLASGRPRDYVIAEDLYSYEPYGLAIQRGDTEFRTVVDQVLARLYRTGQIREVYEKWLGRVGVQPSPILQAMYKINSLPE
ncbi:MAG: amino acid ABC transporter substrate-binding protein [Gammaproteobacteria bacterium]|nr:amino acid ABC transporter substrate-binding protein [Gammaproteobacteria bacterium]